jgi:hypothetical protein
MSFAWTAERIEGLRVDWAEGFSASQIADRIGAPSRSSVLGKLHRLGLSGTILPKRNFCWDDDKCETLRAMLKNGATTGQVALALSTSKQSIRFKMRKLGCAPIVQPRIRVDHNEGRLPGRASVKFAPEALPPQQPVERAGVPLHATDKNGCRFATSEHEASSHAFCNEPQQDGSAYCPWHHRIVYVPAKARRAA